jgi:hypothetical protein
MSTAIATYGGDNEKKWGQANPRRGATHEDTARSFVTRFPVGTTLSAEEFDEWAQSAELLKTPVSTRRDTDAWKAHLQRRHELKYSINQAGSHPRMDTPFVIEVVAQGVWEVRAPQVAISRNKMLDRVESLTKTKRKKLAYLMQSADWSILPPHERAFAEALFDDIEMFQEQLNLSARALSSKFSKLENRLRRAVECGDIKPRNGGIRQIVDGSAEPI